jgi:hypothetical protein
VSKSAVSGSVEDALDRQIEQKIIPLLRGDASVVDEVADVVPDSFGRAHAALAELRRLAEDNVGRIRPRF